MCIFHYKKKSLKKGMKFLVWHLLSVYAKIRTDKYFNKKIVKKSKFSPNFSLFNGIVKFFACKNTRFVVK